MLNETEYRDLIVRYLNNPQDESLHAAVMSFRSESAEQENYFLEMEKVWMLSARSASLENINPKKSAKDFKKALAETTKKTNSTWHWIGRVAAVIALAFAGLWLYNSSTEEVFVVRNTHQNQIDTVAFPDGSRVILSESSELKYSNKFNAQNRDMYLTKGKAFFKIKKDPNHPFRVKMGESTVSVVGTSFNINLSNQKIDLDVKTGKVIFSPYQEGTASVLIAGQALTYDIQKKEYNARLSQNSDSWLTKELVFVDTPLEEVCKQLSEYYETNITLQHSKSTAKKLNATFTNQSLANVLTLLNETYNIKIKKENNQIILITP